MHDRAGTRALPEDLINVDDVISAYYDITPDPTDVGQRVAFGTSGHRGSSLDAKFNEAHIIAITDQTMYKLPYQFGKEKYTYVITALDRLQNESKPVKVKVKL